MSTSRKSYLHRSPDISSLYAAHWGRKTLLNITRLLNAQKPFNPYFSSLHGDFMYKYWKWYTHICVIMMYFFNVVVITSWVMVLKHNLSCLRGRNLHNIFLKINMLKPSIISLLASSNFKCLTFWTSSTGFYFTLGETSNAGLSLRVIILVCCHTLLTCFVPLLLRPCFVFLSFAF